MLFTNSYFLLFIKTIREFEIITIVLWPCREIILVVNLRKNNRKFSTYVHDRSVVNSLLRSVLLQYIIGFHISMRIKRQPYHILSVNTYYIELPSFVGND